MLLTIKIGKTFYWKCQTCFPNGKQERVAEFRDGLENGETKAYYKNGKLNTITTFKYGKEDGTWIFYYESGQIAWENNILMVNDMVPLNGILKMVL